MRIKVDETGCTGHGRCNAMSETVYPLDELGFVVHRGKGEIEVADERRDEAIRGAEECPERAIEVIDGDRGSG